MINFSRPNGAFYFYLDISKTKLDSFKFVRKLINDTGVVLTPGLDFDKKFGQKTVRLSFSSETSIVLDGVDRLYNWFKKNY
jgi:aspartate/methionine/tyrosine aminotransferase